VIRQVVRFNKANWALCAASLIHGRVMAVSEVEGSCSVMLTGGRSAEALYSAWAKHPDFVKLRNVRFYFGDERCVPPADIASNFGLAMRTLFFRALPAECSISRMEAEDPDREGACLRYESLLPSKIDVLLLGVGEDGHIASLFPGGEALGERSRKVVPVTGNKEPRERMTITPVVIEQASSIFVLANGAEKAGVLQRVIASPEDFIALPACLARDATWLLDTVLQSDI
jgi:6-phosphogluconolactonase